MSLVIILTLSFALWVIEIFILYILFFLFLWEGFYFGEIFEDTRLFVIFFISVILFAFAYFNRFPGYEVICLLCLITLPIIITNRRIDERRLKEKRKNEDKEEINRLEKNLESGNADFGIFLRLGYLYKEIKDYESALRYLRKAREATKENILNTTEKEIKELEHESSREQIKENISFKPIYFLITGVFVFSAFLFWVTLGFIENVVFYGLFASNILMFAKRNLLQKNG